MSKRELIVEAALEWASGGEWQGPVKGLRAIDHGVERSIPELSRLAGFSGHGENGESLLKHSLRVAGLLGQPSRYFDLLSRRPRLSEEDKEALEWSGLFHDLGFGIQPGTLGSSDRMRWDPPALAACRVERILRRLGRSAGIIRRSVLVVREQRRILNLARCPVGERSLARTIRLLGDGLHSLVLFSLVHSFEEQADVDAVIRICNRLVELQACTLALHPRRLTLSP